MHWLTITIGQKVKAKAVEVNHLWQCNKIAAMEVNVENVM